MQSVKDAIPGHLKDADKIEPGWRESGIVEKLVSMYRATVLCR